MHFGTELNASEFGIRRLQFSCSELWNKINQWHFEGGGMRYSMSHISFFLSLVTIRVFITISQVTYTHQIVVIIFRLLLER